MFTHVTSVEKALIKKLHSQGMGLRKIRAVTGRSFDTLSKHLFPKNVHKKVKAKGRPRLINARLLKRLRVAHEKLVSERPSVEVTIKRVKAKVGLTCTDRTVLNAFHQHGLYFRPMYEKPEISEDDRRQRMAFADVNGTRAGRRAGGRAGGRAAGPQETPRRRPGGAQEAPFWAFFVTSP